MRRIAKSWKDLEGKDYYLTDQWKPCNLCRDATLLEDLDEDGFCYECSQKSLRKRQYDDATIPIKIVFIITYILYALVSSIGLFIGILIATYVLLVPVFLLAIFLGVDELVCNLCETFLFPHLFLFALLLVIFLKVREPALNLLQTLLDIVRNRK